MSDTKSIVRTVPLAEGDVIDIRIAWVRGKRHTIRVTVPKECDVEIAKNDDNEGDE